MFELVDADAQERSLEFETLAGALSATRSIIWRTTLWKIYGPWGEVRATWDGSRYPAHVRGL